VVERRENSTDTGKAAETAARILATVGEVAAELHPQRTDSAITLDSSLDRDLGFDSLGRVEVLLRIERAFGVSLPEHVFARAETPRDLLRAVFTARGAEDAVIRRDRAEIVIEAPGQIPFGAETLVEVLEWHARVHPDRPHIQLYGDDVLGEVITFRGLKEGAEKVAAGLQAGDLQSGQSVIIMLPTGSNYFFSFFGVLMAGGVPVPIYPPGRPSQIEEHLRRHASIVTNCLGAVLITVPEAKRFGGLLRSQVETLGSVVTVDELTERAGLFVAPKIGAGEVAFLQFTSGSTGSPKGVVLTHANLLANIRAMGKALEIKSRDVFVSWLPLYHDMGLIGAWLGNLYYANLLVIMSPLAFLSKPERWLWAIHRARGTVSAAPNFAFELCLRRIDDNALEGLDLSSWRLALNGAEAISPETMQRFTERFGPYGFGANTMMPVYGLAECSVGLAFPPIGRGPVVDRVQRDVFMKTGRAMEAVEDDTRALAMVNCGRPLTGHQIRIVDDAGREVPERREGRLQYRGPSTTSGYFRNSQATAELFDGEWLNSGDLAYIAGGDVHISGRTKDIIIRAGRNIYPAEFEDAVGGLEGLQKGYVAVFGSNDPATGTERLVVVAETRNRKPEDQEALRQAINGLAVDLIGGPPDDVVLAPLRTVLKTSSGKVRRAANRDIYERGLIGKPPSALWWQITRLGLAAAGTQFRRGLSRARGVLFAASATGLFAIVAPVFWVLTVALPYLTWRWAVTGLGFRMLSRLLGIRVSVHGLANLPPAGSPAVFVSNHSSYLDGLVLTSALPRPISFVAKAELQDNWVTRLPLRRLEAEFVERFDLGQGIDDARQVTRNLRDGYSPLFFAEGTLTRMPGLLPFQMGAFMTAAEAGAPMVPITIRGTRSMLRDGTWFLRPGAITVIIGKTIEPAPLAGKEELWTEAVKLRDQVRREILNQCGEPDLEKEPSFIPVLKQQRPD